MSLTLFYIPEDVATMPVDGDCLRDRWWIVHPEKGLAFKAELHGQDRSDKPGPQCNRDEAMTRHFLSQFSSSDPAYGGFSPDNTVKHIPAVFLAHAIKEMERLRSAEKGVEEAVDE